MRRRDERAAEGLEKELKRLFELDRNHRLMNGAAETNLAALRERVRAGKREGREGGRRGRNRERLRYPKADGWHRRAWRGAPPPPRGFADDS